MPKTKFQTLIFSVMMAVVMVYGMELYNVALAAGGLKNELFAYPFKDMLLMTAIVILLEKTVGGPVAKKLVRRAVAPDTKKPLAATLFMSAFTVCVMCPMMSLAATILFKDAKEQFVFVWLQTAARNFPMAFFWQMFFAGPLVRFSFRRIFAKQLAAGEEREEG